MPIVGGLDIHRKQITFDYLGTGTGQVRRGQVSPADREHLRAWLARFAGREDVAFAVVWGSETRFGVSCRQLGSDVVFVGESAEDLPPADPVLGEVDRFRRPGAGLSWGELAEGTVRPGGVVVPHVLGQHLAQMALIDDQQSVEEFPAQGCR